MKFFKAGLSLALLGTGLAFSPAAPTAAADPQQTLGAPGAPAGVAAMRQVADGDVTITDESATGKVGFIAARGADADLMPTMAADTTAQAAAKVDAYLDEFGATFGATDGALTRTGIVPNRYGWTVSYVQRYQGLEVFGSRLKANLDTDGDLTSVSGYAVPDLDLAVTPRYSAGEAAQSAVSLVRAQPGGPAEGEPSASDTDGAGTLSAGSTELMVYRTGALSGQSGENVLAYLVEVTGPGVRDMVVVDADTRKPINRWSTVTDADKTLERELYEESPDSDPVWSEGDPFPGDLNPDQQNLVNSAGEAYWFYRNTFGRDSYDGLGAVMKTVNNDPSIECPNANWNGETTNYCDGVTSDDVVSHEWGHAYTEYTSGLIYQYQSGALNESYSDVWGETLDLINAREDEGETFDAKRPDGECDPTASPSLQVEITAPADVAGPCRAAAASTGEGYSPETVTTDVVVATDAENAAGPTANDGCTTFTNAAEIEGNYAYVDRGTCTFQVKIDNAVEAGATGFVVGNNATGLPTSISADADISGFMVTKADGERFKAAGTSTVEITAEDISDRTESTRWLVGEKSEAFGGAIRDMWTPTCYGDPGKVSDAEYNCDPLLTDAGGVHGNSGVPNHAYALVVDGGSFNGQTIRGIGLDKAANIWWRAQTAYLTPTSDFTAAADALEASCTDLVGKKINQVSTETNGTPTPADKIVASDCTQVAKTMTAVEMRTEPVQCEFKPLLAKNTPSLCGENFTEKIVYTEDFEDGLKGWNADQELADLPELEYAGGFGAPWEVVKEAAGDHRSKVAYGPVPDRGDCSGDGVGDFSSRDGITSGDITLPARGLSPILSFDHYIASEAGFDGGNVKVSVDGGEFTAVPAEAYLFNAPGQLSTLEEQNTNPMAGQPGFTGTDQGEVRGSWGTSQIDLSMLDVAPGDTMRIRLDVGRDGCGGIDRRIEGEPEPIGGWYVDNVTVSLCREIAATETTVARTAPKQLRQGGKAIVFVKVGAEGAQGAQPGGGLVEISRGETVLGQAAIRQGRTAVIIDAPKQAGPATLKVRYLGTKKFAASSTTYDVQVKAAAPRTGPRG